MSDAPDFPDSRERVIEALKDARSGLRRHVETLMAALDECELLVPLARDVPEAPEGERVEFEGELTIVPHLLPDAEGTLFAVLFTHGDPLEPIVEALDWTTGDEPLKVCAFPASVALEMALEVIDDKNVLGLVIDPGAPSELCLTRSELASLIAGRPVPLIAYVGDIPEHERARTLVADGAEPAAPELLALVGDWASRAAGVLSHRLERTFNPDRDLEPHLSLTLSVAAGADRRALFESVTRALEGRLPPPGYVDVLFQESALPS